MCRDCKPPSQSCAMTATLQQPSRSVTVLGEAQCSSTITLRDSNCLTPSHAVIIRSEKLSRGVIVSQQSQSCAVTLCTQELLNSQLRTRCLTQLTQTHWSRECECACQTFPPCCTTRICAALPNICNTHQNKSGAETNCRVRHSGSQSPAAVTAHDCDCWLTITPRDRFSLRIITAGDGVRQLLSRSVIVLHLTR